MSLLKKRATKTKNIKKFRNKKFNLNNFVEEYYMEQNTAYITVKVDNYNDIVSKLREISDLEKIEITDDALNEIAKISDGGMRDSINFLDQLRSFTQGNITINDVYEVCGNVSLEEIYNLFVNIKENNLNDITVFLEGLNNNGKNYGKFLEDVMLFIKDLILYKKDVSLKLIKTDDNYLNKLSKLYSLKDLFYIVDVINNLIDKIKYVSRQSVVVLTNFLLISNTINDVLEEKDLFITENITKKEEKNDFGLAFDFTSNDKKQDNDLTVDIVKNENKSVVGRKEISFENKDIIINNAFALADKQLKMNLQSKWNALSDYLTDNHFANIAGKFADIKLEVVGGNYIIFTAMYESMIDGILDNFRLSNDFVNNVFDDKYYFVVITDSEWNKYKEEYIKNLKNGIKYEIKEIIQEKMDDNSQKEITIVDKLFDLVGEENIEFK